MPCNIVARQRIPHPGHVAGGHAARVLVLVAEVLPGPTGSSSSTVTASALDRPEKEVSDILAEPTITRRLPSYSSR